MERSKKKRLTAAIGRKVILVMNIILSFMTVFLGIISLLFAELEFGIAVAFLAVDGACVVAILQEVNSIILRHDKRTIITSSICMTIYTVLFFFPMFAPGPYENNPLLVILAIVAACIYVTVRFGKAIANAIIDKPSGYIVQSILLGLILVGSIFFLAFNHSSPLNVCYYLGVFLIGEGLIFTFATFISGMAARRFVKILVRTHAAQILVGLFVMMIVCSVILLFTEGGDQPGQIQTFGDAMWYCFATITTIGFGDFAAKSFAGRIVTVLLGIYGIGVVALITSIIVNMYNDSVEASKNQTTELEKKIDELAKKNRLLIMAKPEEEAPEEEADSKPKGKKGKKKGAHEDAEDPAGQEVEESAHQNGEDEAAGDESLSQ